MSNITFRELRLDQTLLTNVDAEGYTRATPIQAEAIPRVLSGRDVLASAPTGTGKTAAFTLPMLQRLGKAKGPRKIRGLVLCPTRELATQIANSLSAYGHGFGLRHVVLYGGVNQHKQTRALKAGVDIVIATPGRLMDLIDQGFVKLHDVKMFVLDEADRMLDMGFIPAVRKIASYIPAKRQTLMFSATVPPTIKKLVAELMNSPERIEVKGEEVAADQIDQSIFFVKKEDKPDLLAHVVKQYGVKCGIVFSRTKHGAERIVRQLKQRGHHAVSIHGNKNQNQRQRALDTFKAGKVPLLVATDVAARGIDVDGVTHVINYDLTHEPETYVHRIGRTGRAGAYGKALSFCNAEEREHLKAIQKLLGREIEVDSRHPYTDGKQRVPMKPQGPSGKPKAAKAPRASHPLEHLAGGGAGTGKAPKKKGPKKPHHRGQAGKAKRRGPRKAATR
ncbi:MAG: DEAD/DEAH box helicase [Planctomycetota bacterium]